MKRYEAVIVGVMFDEHYEFEDILVHGIAHSKEEAFAIQQEEIMRLCEDYPDENGKGHPVVYSEGRSTYDDPICILKYELGYEHIYCKFMDRDETAHDSGDESSDN